MKFAFILECQWGQNGITKTGTQGPQRHFLPKCNVQLSFESKTALKVKGTNPKLPHTTAYQRQCEFTSRKPLPLC